MAKTHWREAFNSPYLGSWDVPDGKDLIATISHVKQEEVIGEGGKKQNCNVVHFGERNLKPMILNATNGKTLRKLFGSDYIEDWRGQAIQIYVAKTTRSGETVDGLRIRPMFARTTKDNFAPDHPGWIKAKQSIADGTVTIDAIRSKYNLTDEHAALLQSGGDANAT